MTTTFYLIYKTAPSIPSPSRAQCSPLATHKQPTITTEFLELDLESLEQKNTNCWDPVNRALHTAALAECIQAICSEHFYVQRGADIPETQLARFTNMEFHRARAKEIFYVANYIDLSNTTCEFKPNLKESLREILTEILFNTTHTKQVALDIHDTENLVSTYVWIKV